MSLRLTIVKGQDQDRSVDLLDAAVTIGRASDCELPIRGDGEVSRRHAVLELAPDGTATIRDLNSTNGTFVDGTRISGPTPVAAGVRVRVGDTELLAAPLGDDRTVPGHEPWAASGPPAAPAPYAEPGGGAGEGAGVASGDPLAGPAAQGDYGPPPQAGGDQGYDQPPPQQEWDQQQGYDQPAQGYDQPAQGYDQPGQGGYEQPPADYGHDEGRYAPQQPDWRADPGYGHEDPGYGEQGGAAPPPVAPPPVAPGGPSIPGARAPYRDQPPQSGGGYGPPPVQPRAPRRQGQGQGGGGPSRNVTALIVVGALIGALILVVVILFVSGVV